MNRRCDEEPKRKRLKQSSIEESFKRHRSSFKSKTSLHLAGINYFKKLILGEWDVSTVS